MDEVLEVAELATDAGLEEALGWLLRLLGVLLLLAGVGLWLFTEMGLLWIPAVLMVLGVVLLVVPSILFGLLELVA